ncbi:MAG: molybdopterin oxidoreductase family protein [Candidatus Scalindua sp.]
MTIVRKKSICPYCGVGCGVIVGVEDGRVLEVSGMEGYPVNDGDICHLAVNLPSVFASKERLTKPMIRREGELMPAGWDETIAHTASNLKRIIDKHGPDSVAFYGGAINLNEEYYLINKLMKAAIGTNNVDCSTRLCMSSTAQGFISTLGMDAPPACYADIEEADLFFIAGNNMAVSLPILFKRIKAAKEKNGAKVIVVDPRRIETTSIADIHLQVWPGTDVALNNAIAHILLKEGYVDEERVKLYCSGLSDLKEHLEEYTPSRAATITGCSEDMIKETAHTIGKAKAMLALWFMGYNHSTQAVFKNNTLHNILLLTGNYCRPGAGPLAINGEANTQGNRWVGTLSHLLPGVRMITNPQHRQELADFWNIPVDKISPVPGRSIIDIIKGLHSGDVCALWITTTNPAVSLPDSRWIEEGLGKAEFLIVQDIFHPTETTMLADVVLAGAHWCEKTGTYISSERRVELVEKMVDPPGEAKADYEIIWLVARAMGFKKEFPYTTPEEVFEEFKKITNGRICDMGGVSYERLRKSIGPQLPCPDDSHPGTPRLFQDMRFPRLDGRAALLAREYMEPAEKTDGEYPFVLITGRLSIHFNTRTRSGREKSTIDVEPRNFIEIHPDDAAGMDINSGDELEVVSRRGSVRGDARITDRVLIRTVYMNMHYGKILGVGSGKQANLVTNQAYDSHTKQPEFKYSAVKIINKAIL